jgi:hypothetical protein
MPYGFFTFLDCPAGCIDSTSRFWKENAPHTGWTLQGDYSIFNVKNQTTRTPGTGQKLFGSWQAAKLEQPPGLQAAALMFFTLSNDMLGVLGIEFDPT